MGRAATANPATTVYDHLMEQERSTITRSELQSLGVHSQHLKDLLEQGVLERSRQGLYQHTGLPYFQFEDLKTAQLLVPTGVVCLTTALEVHELTTQKSHQIHLAVPTNTWKPHIDHVQYHSFTPKIHSYGIEEKDRVRVYTVEKTLADLLHHRNKIGMDIFKEALTAYLGSRSVRLYELMEATRICKVETRMRELLEVMV